MEDRKLDRTWLGSVVFMDIVNYSKQSVQLQMKWKERFNAYLAEAIHDVPEIDRVILDTGDGAVRFGVGSLAFYRGDEELRVTNTGQTGLTLLAFLSPPFPPRSGT